MSVPTLRHFLAERPFHLALSAGFFGFYAHAGLLSALEENNLLPASISGASAGALVGGLWAAGLSSARIEQELAELRREHFWDPRVGFGLLGGRLFLSKVDSLVQGRTFGDTRVAFAASAWDVRLRSTVSLQSGALAPAICASCALPGLFHPVRVGGRLYLDGGVADRPAHAWLPAGRAVLYHHLPTTSPWRLQSPELPARSGMVTVVLPGLPRPGPFHLHRGPVALREVRARVRALLDVPVQDSGCVLTGARRA